MMTTINSKGTISNIKFENISGIGGMLGAGQAIFLDDRSNSRRIQDISLNSVKIDAANGAGYGAQINGVLNISIKDSEVSNSEGTGLVLQNSKNVKLKSIKIIKPRSANSNGMSIDNTKNISMHDVTIDSPKLYGIYINNKLGNVKNVKVSKLIVKGINKANIAVYEENSLEEHNKVSKFSHD
ncbi:right-handed parallel beta-helix repeat-containing protein [Priestia sp. OVL9]|nr:right-handed parallel beta-helix repeat-containing protein [Priestia sp. OVL9]